MKKHIRIDKLLSNMGIGTRSVIKKEIKKGKLQIGNQTITDPGHQVDIENDEILFNGALIKYQQYKYFMLNKPKGVITATKDDFHKTVMDIIDNKQKKDMFPVGRLDKDTEGLLLITNDGELCHELLSPKKHVPKTYFAEIDGKVTDEDVRAFEEGVIIDKDYKTLPAQLEIIESHDISKIRVTIYEGKFHQVKKMFIAVGKKVTYLKRLSMGQLELDKNLKIGNYRPLTKEEINLLRNKF